MSSSNSGKTKKSKSSKIADDFIVVKEEKWTKDNLIIFVKYALFLTLIPIELFGFVYDYPPFSIVSIIVYIIAFIPCFILLDGSFIPVFINYKHKLRCSTNKDNNNKNIEKMNMKAKYWTIFYVNTLFLGIFLFNNIYVFRDNELHYRIPLTTNVAAAVTFFVTKKTNP